MFTSPFASRLAFATASFVLLASPGAAQNNSLDAADGTPPQAVLVDADGNFGVGTLSPQSKLHVAGATRIDGVLDIRSLTNASWLKFTPNAPVATSAATTAARQGVLDLFTQDGTTRTVSIRSGWQSAPPAASGGSIRLFDEDGSLMAFLGDNPTTAAGSLSLYDSDQDLRCSLTHQGLLLKNRDDHDVIHLDVEDGAGRMLLRDALGHLRSQIDTGGRIRQYNAAEARTIDINPASDVYSAGSPLFRMYRGNGSTVAVEITATEGGSPSDGAQISVSNAAGVRTIILDAERGGVGGPSRIYTDTLEVRGGSDFAEHFDVAGVPAAPTRTGEAPSSTNLVAPEPGMVVSIDVDNPGKLVVSSRPADRRVAGVISGAGNVAPGVLMSHVGTIADGSVPVSLSGRVFTWCDASHGAISPGDQLTTSPTAGHAMRASTPTPGTIVGKAMTSLASGRGLVLVLVTLQ